MNNVLTYSKCIFLDKNKIKLTNKVFHFLTYIQKKNDILSLLV